MSMVYVALLRGINVGGNRKVEMARLKVTFEELGFENVKTFINSGNVIFSTRPKDDASLAKQIEAAIARDFGFEVPTIVRDLPFIEGLIKQIPDDWVNDKGTKCDVMLLWKEIDNSKVLEQISFNPDMEKLEYTPGAVLWRVDRKHATKSRVPKIVGTPLYKKMTIRNANSVRKIYALMKAVED